MFREYGFGTGERVGGDGREDGPLEDRDEVSPQWREPLGRKWRDSSFGREEDGVHFVHREIRY